MSLVSRTEHARSTQSDSRATECAPNELSKPGRTEHAQSKRSETTGHPQEVQSTAGDSAAAESAALQTLKLSGATEHAQKDPPPSSTVSMEPECTQSEASVVPEPMEHPQPMEQSGQCSASNAMIWSAP